MPRTPEQLPGGACTLIAFARVAHRAGDRQLERSALDKLAREYGLTVGFVCEESVEQALRQTESPPKLEEQGEVKEV